MQKQFDTDGATVVRIARPSSAPTWSRTYGSVVKEAASRQVISYAIRNYLLYAALFSMPATSALTDAMARRHAACQAQLRAQVLAYGTQSATTGKSPHRTLPCKNLESMKCHS